MNQIIQKNWAKNLQVTSRKSKKLKTEALAGTIQPLFLTQKNTLRRTRRVTQLLNDPDYRLVEQKYYINKAELADELELDLHVTNCLQYENGQIFYNPKYQLDNVLDLNIITHVYNYSLGRVFPKYSTLLGKRSKYTKPCQLVKLGLMTQNFLLFLNQRITLNQSFDGKQVNLEDSSCSVKNIHQLLTNLVSKKLNSQNRFNEKQKIQSEFQNCILEFSKAYDMKLSKKSISFLERNISNSPLSCKFSKLVELRIKQLCFLEVLLDLGELYLAKYSAEYPKMSKIQQSCLEMQLVTIYISTYDSFIQKDPSTYSKFQKYAHLLNSQFSASIQQYKIDIAIENYKKYIEYTKESGFHWYKFHKDGGINWPEPYFKIFIQAMIKFNDESVNNLKIANFLEIKINEKNRKKRKSMTKRGKKVSKKDFSKVKISGNQIKYLKRIYQIGLRKRALQVGVSPLDLMKEDYRHFNFDVSFEGFRSK